MAPNASSLLREFNLLSETQRSRELSSDEAQRYELLRDVLLELGAVPAVGRTQARAARINAVLEVNFGTKEDLTRAYSKDIGAGGIAVKTSKVPSVGSTLEVRIRLPGTELMVVAHGRVAWAKDGEMGIEFVQLSPEAERRIKEHLVGSDALLSRVRTATEVLPELSGPANSGADQRPIVVVRLSVEQEQHVVLEVLRQAGLRVTSHVDRNAVVAVGDAGTAIDLVQMGAARLVLLNASGPDALVGTLAKLDPAAYVRRRAPTLEIVEAVRSLLAQLSPDEPRTEHPAEGKHVRGDS